MEYVPRSGWGARPPRSTARFWGHLGMAVHYSAGLSPRSHDLCPVIVRGIQAFHMRPKAQGGKGMVDIAYNWPVCPHGVIYEGRGWEARSGAQGTAFGNRYYGATCWLGGPGDTPTDEALLGIAIVLNESRRRGFGGGLHPHNWFKSTQCPGPLNAWVRGEEGEEVVGLIDTLRQIDEQFRSRGSNPAAIGVAIDLIRKERQYPLHPPGQHGDTDHLEAAIASALTVADGAVVEAAEARRLVVALLTAVRQIR